MARTRPLPLDSPCLGLGNLAAFQPSCFPRMAWQLGTERVLQLDSFIPSYRQMKSGSTRTQLEPATRPTNQETGIHPDSRQRNTTHKVAESSPTAHSGSRPSLSPSGRHSY
ncbi:hypothetical protein CSKR_111789 [Clonorchis sinensis]|uniref:Uncharacterized protein n=1 Tax=Clonorchis sinensis TaxID=79923 RepID=A0A419PST0_CLOSI|nr:hypothetical protein CSKR_111789 [Clonorchis sinensis]